MCAARPLAFGAAPALSARACGRPPAAVAVAVAAVAAAAAADDAAQPRRRARSVPLGVVRRPQPPAARVSGVNGPPGAPDRCLDAYDHSHSQSQSQSQNLSLSLSRSHTPNLAENEDQNDSENQNENQSQSQDRQPATGPSRSLASLHELTERIADLLHVGSLQEASQHDLLCPKDAPVGLTRAGTPRHHVAIVFGKRLIGDKLTVEYAKRVVTLVKQIARRAIDPDTICFTGGRRADPGAVAGTVSEALAGYMFFRAVCDEIGIDASRFEYVLEEESQTTAENVANVLREIRSKLGADALAKCHFTLVSSDYHLIRIQEVHRICPRHSLLFPLEVAAATWNCIFAAYPFCVSPDPAIAFLGRAVVLANDLNIVLVNLSSVVKDRQFFARENLGRLNETFAKMRDMFRVVDPVRKISHSGFRIDMRAHSETLELAIHRVREAHTLLSPLSDPCCSIPRDDFLLAYSLISGAVKDMRNTLDPDRPLRLSDHADVLEDLASFINMHEADENPHQRTGSEPTANFRRYGSSYSISAQSRDRGAKNGTLQPLKRIGRDGPNVVVMESESAREKTTELRTDSALQSNGASFSHPAEKTLPQTRRRISGMLTTKSTTVGSTLKSRTGASTLSRRRTPAKRTTTAKEKSKATPAGPQV